MQDIVRELGFLCLGTRFKRIGERLQADTQALIDGAGFAVQVHNYPLLAALDRLGPLTIGELVDALGITQPGVTRNVAKLTEDGLLVVRSAPDDQRKRIVALSPRGHEVVNASKQELWPLVEAAVRDACADRDGPLLDLLGALEDALADAPLASRKEAVA